jgi:hypothetical protein
MLLLNPLQRICGIVKTVSGFHGPSDPPLMLCGIIGGGLQRRGGGFGCGRRVC